MSISYRLTKKELILLLDLYGDINSLEQRFGDVYITSDEHRRISDELEAKGFVTVSGESIIPDTQIGFITEKMYSAGSVLADADADMWLYCSDDIIVTLNAGRFGNFGFTVGTVMYGDELSEFADEIRSRYFTEYRAEKCSFYGEALPGYLESVMKI